MMVTWCDAFSMAEWLSLEEVFEEAEKKGWEVTEVGWLLRETKEYIVIASQLQTGGSFGNITKVPKTWIRERVVLKKGGRR